MTTNYIPKLVSKCTLCERKLHPEAMYQIVLKHRKILVCPQCKTYSKTKVYNFTYKRWVSKTNKKYVYPKKTKSSGVDLPVFHQRSDMGYSTVGQYYWEGNR